MRVKVASINTQICYRGILDLFVMELKLLEKSKKSSHVGAKVASIRVQVTSIRAKVVST